jgi:cholesterol transport system auxiliary component
MNPSKLIGLAALACTVAGCALGLAPEKAASLFTLGTSSESHPPAATPAQVILVAPSAARPGFDGGRIVYVTRAYEIRFFARHEWVAPPAQMLAPLLVEALERGGRFRAVQSTADVSSPFRLETEIVALQQEFTVQPSVARFALRAQLVDTVERRVLAAEEFEAVEPAPSEDPYGGVVAASRAAARVLGDLARWCDTHTPQAAAPK